MDIFSINSFRKGLKELNNEAHHFTEDTIKPNRLEASASLFSRLVKSAKLIIKEPEILTFSLLQAMSIFIAYGLWIQMISWIPEEVWESAKGSNETGGIDLILAGWAFICVGLASLPIGFFTACINATHILNRQGEEATFTKSIQFVFPRIWSIWLFSWIDGWITVRQIVRRLPQKNDSWASRALSEALYYAWKLGTAGMIPALMTSKGPLSACKNSIGFLKSKPKDIILLRVGYSTVSWIVGISTYFGSCACISFINSITEKEALSSMYTLFLYTLFPLIISITFLKVFIRPFYLLSLFDLYSDYMKETNQKEEAPAKSFFAQFAILFFLLLIVLVFFVFLFRDQMGLSEALSTPYTQ